MGNALLCWRGEKGELRTEMASLYRGVAERLSSFRYKVKKSGGEDLHYNAIDTKANPDLLKEQADLLESILQVESIIAEKAKQILA